MTRSRFLAIVLAAAALIGGGGLLLQAQPFPHRVAQPPSSRSPLHQSVSTATVYLHYYLWWTPLHWRDKLGPEYPYAAARPPLPGRMDANGCNPQVDYTGAQVVDLPTDGLYDQTQAGTFDDHISRAAASGVTGFLVSWQGTGDSRQTPTSSGYDARLDLLVSRADAFVQAHPGGFGLGLAFASFGDYIRPAAQVIADLEYFAARYGSRPAFRNRYSEKPLVMWLDSRKYPEATVKAVSDAVRSHVYLVGDETPASWARDAPFLDATSYYWSSENPWRNTSAGSKLAELGAAVRAQGKRWFAPFTPGYNKQLIGGSCVPRYATRTLRQVWAVNSRSRPDGWFGISWNEMVENTYMQPTRAYGSAYLDTLAGLIKRQ